MNQSDNRNFVTRRMAIGTLSAVVLLPAMLWLGVILTHFDSHAQKVLPDDQELPIEPSSISVAPRLDARPVVETRYEERREIVIVPVVDPVTGKSTLHPQEQVVHVNVNEMRPVRNISSGHSQQVMKLVDELQKMKKSDDGYEKAIQEMKSLLLQEFDLQHQQRGEEIEDTAERLETLRKLHQQRESNKDQIVQRRIDQLIGEPDNLRWESATGDANRNAAPASRVRYGFLRRNVSPSLGGQEPIRAPNIAEPRSVHPSPYRRIDTPDATPQQTAKAPPVPPREDPYAPAGPVYAPRVQRNEVNQTRRIEVSSSGSGEVFQLARSLSSAALAETTAKAECERLKQLQKQGAVPVAEYRKQELKLEQAKLDLAFARAEWESLNERVNRDLRSAKDRLAIAERQTEMVNAAVNSGEERSSELLKVQGMLEQIRKSFEDAQSKARELSQAKTLIDEFDQDTNKEDKTAEPDKEEEQP